MAGADNIYTNPLEKPKSSDINDMQALQARVLTLLLKHWTESRLGGAAAADAYQHPVVNGCLVQGLAANSVTVSPGFILQQSSTISPVPGTYDSDYRIALNTGNLVVATPSPVSNTYYLLEAQMQEVTTNESRDILNTSTKVFTSTSVPKIRQRTLNTQWKVGTTTDFPTPTGGDWVVLAGVLVPAGGGPVNADAVYDMRLQPDMLLGEAYLAPELGPERSSIKSELAATSMDVSFDGVPVVATGRGLRASAKRTASESLSTTDAVLGHATLTADTWYYVYMSHWNGLLPRIRRTGMRTRGLFFLSTTAPDAQTRLSNTTLSARAPFSTFVIPAGEAVCVDVLRSHTVNGQLRAHYGSNGRVRFGRAASTALQILSTPVTGSPFSLPTTNLPVGPKTLKLRIRMTNVNTTGTTANSYLSLTVVRNGLPTQTMAAVDVPAPSVGDNWTWQFEVEVPYDAAGYQIYLFLVNAGTIDSGTFAVDLMGWEW